MRILLMILISAISFNSWAHILTLLLPIKGTPITSYFVGQAEISRAIYSELTQPHDFFVAQFMSTGDAENSFEILTPVCPMIPIYEDVQPSALLLRRDLPWKDNGESNSDYILRLEKVSVAKIESNFTKGKRPQYYEEFGKQNYWVGGKLRLQLASGLYAIVVYDSNFARGNFTLGINEKESWTPDLYKYVSEVTSKIRAGICDPKGFSGTM